ncbi:MAG TPA: hypothetical protein VLT59_15895 [Steroidobacteraceae bacterium]|nr:hypothetical protein [Steroidobacteraceae bacterium]
MGTTLATKADRLLVPQETDNKFLLLSRDIETVPAAAAGHARPCA